MSAPCILLVDDQREVLRLLHSTLNTLPHELQIFEAPSGEEALLEASRRKIDLLVADYRLPGITGVELMRKIRIKYPDVRVILITGLTDRKSREDILNAGAAAVFDKPISLTDFLDVVERSLGLERIVLPDEVDDDGRHQTLSNLLANLRQDIEAQAVLLLSDRGRVLARAGDLKDRSMEASLLSALMAIYSAGLKVSRLMHQATLESYHVFAGGDHDLLLIPVNAAYALLVAGHGQATNEKILETVSVALTVRDEVEKALKSIGVAPIVADEEEAAQAKYQEPVTQGSSDEMARLLNARKKMSTGELEAYWEAAVEKHGNVPTNPDVISYEQARQLGLAPDEKV